MRQTNESVMRDIRDKYNSIPAYRHAFTIRGQEYKFETREQYQEAWGRALEIADKQQRWIESGRDLEEFDLQEALEDSGQEKQYELQFESGHDSGDECNCEGCIEQK